VAAFEAAHTWRALARNAFESATAEGGGPVHLNLPFREPLIAESDELPDAHLGPVGTTERTVRLGTLAMDLERERGLIVAGRGVDDVAAVERLAAATRWPVLADPRSGCRGIVGAISAFDAILRHDGFAASHVPDVVVHLGEPPASKVLATWLRDAAGTQVTVSASRRVIDPSHVITHRVTASVGAFCSRLANELRGATGTDWSSRWEGVHQQVVQSWAPVLGDAAPLTEPAVAHAVSRFPGTVVLASSMPIRDVEWYGSPDQRAAMFSNRGANGIDGTIATAIGVAVGSGAPVVVLVGDVALLHDQSSLTALVRRGIDVRIVVVDNDGGGIFSFLPQAAALSGERFEQLFGTPHGTDVCALAAAHGLPAATVCTGAELESWLGRPGPWLVRVPSTRAENVAAHRALNELAVRSISPT
jgi:2-succinyl-5-enolpyruvyl-6-hydroxy-3-cyclohexene-1-carboxylate synthase